MSSWQSHEPCAACDTMAVDRCYHHIYTRKAHPEFINESWNLMSLCAVHHNMIHAKGAKYMASKFQAVRIWLMENNWRFCELTGKLTHD